MTGYDWRQLIYFMAEDNMLSGTRIAGLKKCLKVGMYQYDPTLITSSMWPLTYYYNSLVDAFLPMSYNPDPDSTVAASVLGYNRLRTYMVNGNAIYGKDPSYSYYDFSDVEEVALRREAQIHVEEWNNNVMAIANQYQEEYWEGMSEVWSR